MKSSVCCVEVFCFQAGEAVSVWGKASMNPVNGDREQHQILLQSVELLLLSFTLPLKSYNNAVGKIVNTKSLYSQI